MRYGKWVLVNDFCQSFAVASRGKSAYLRKYNIWESFSKLFYTTKYDNLN